MKISRNIVETAVNILILACLVLVLGLLVYRYSPFWAAAPGNDATQIETGAKIDLPNINWAQNHATLVLALAVGCHYCQESAAFYRDLIASNTNGAFRPLAVLPQEVEQSKKYLRDEGIIADVRQVDFDKLGVKGTPTLILVDSAGHIEAKWVGKLSSEDESKVYKSVGVQPHLRPDARDIDQGARSLPLDGAIRDSDVLAGSQLLSTLNSHLPPPVLDTRSRPSYAVAHILGSFNIPVDELEVRAKHEIPPDSAIVVYCGYTAMCEASAGAHGKSSSCSLAVEEMRASGFTNARVIKGDLAALKTMGISVVGDVSAAKN
jgi:rhodanese-related sulfurtransferase